MYLNADAGGIPQAYVENADGSDAQVIADVSHRARWWRVSVAVSGRGACCLSSRALRRRPSRRRNGAMEAPDPRVVAGRVRDHDPRSVHERQATGYRRYRRALRPRSRGMPAEAPGWSLSLDQQLVRGCAARSGRCFRSMTTAVTPGDHAHRSARLRRVLPPAAQPHQRSRRARAGPGRSRRSR